MAHREVTTLARAEASPLPAGREPHRAEAGGPAPGGHPCCSSSGSRATGTSRGWWQAVPGQGTLT
jgi:hypothetical protein